MKAAGSTIIVALDGSLHAAVALPVAKTLAQILGATLHVVHVTERRMLPPELMDELGLSVDDLRGSVLDVVRGHPADGVVETARAWRAAAIVLCTNTGLPAPDRPLGPIAERVILTTATPVVLVPPARHVVPWRLGQILLPHDGTPTTAGAIGPAIDLAVRADARLTALHVAVPGAPPEAGAYGIPRYLDQPHHEWPRWAAEFLERLCCGMPLEPRRLRLLLARGEPGAEIVRVVSETSADLIVLGWRGSLEPARAATLKTVLARATCPVMVLKVPG